MQARSDLSRVINWIFGLSVFTVGILNMVLVHPVPGIAYVLLALMYLPPADDLVRKGFGFSIPSAVKIVLGIVLIFFTFGVSDLGNIIDQW